MYVAKSTLLICLTLGLTISHAQSTSDGLISRYTFDQISGSEVINSVSGAASSYLESGAQIFANGYQHNAVALDGVNDRVTAQFDFPSTSGLTLATWIQPSTLKNESYIISKTTGTYSSRHLWAVSLVRYTSTSARIRFYLRVNGSTYSITSNTTQLVPINQWSHIAATYDGSMMKLYKNGLLIASSSRSGAIANNATVDVALGNLSKAAKYSYSYYAYQGLLDEVRAYQRAVNVSELPSIMNPLPLAPTQLMAQTQCCNPGAMDKVLLQWQDQASNEEGYTLQRIALSGNWVGLPSPFGENTVSLSANTINFNDDFITAAGRYRYILTAFNQEGVSNSVSLEVEVKSGLPLAPSNLVINSICMSGVPYSPYYKIQTQWIDNSDNETEWTLSYLSFDVSGGPGAGIAMQVVTTVAANTPSLFINGISSNARGHVFFVPSNKTMYLQLAARNAYGPSTALVFPSEIFNNALNCQ